MYSHTASSVIDDPILINGRELGRVISIPVNQVAETRRPTGPYILATPDFRPNTGGVAEVMHHLWSELASFGDAWVYSSARGRGPLEKAPYGLVQLQCPPDRNLGSRAGDTFPLFRKLNSARYFASQERFGRDLARHLLETHGENIHVFLGWWDQDTHYWCKAFRQYGIPYDIFVHGLDITAPYYGWIPAARERDYRAARALWACSHATKRLVQDRLRVNCPVLVTHPGVALKPPTPDHEKRTRALREQLKLEGQAVILTLGRVIRRKGFDVVIRCVDALRHDFPALRYLIAGHEDMPEAAEFKELARTAGLADRVTFLGAVDSDTKLALYDICDIFVMPNREMDGSDFEGFGIVFLEAALRGKPVIGGNNGGVRDAVEDNVTGILVDSESVDSVAQAIRRLLNDADARRNMGAAGSARARERFAWDGIAASFVEREAALSLSSASGASVPGGRHNLERAAI